MRTVDPKLTAERKSQIMIAALACFREKGFHGASMSTICKRAKMSPGHLYHYFSSKEDLIAAIVEQDSEITMAKVKAIIESDDIFEALLLGLDDIWDHDAEMQGTVYGEIFAEAARSQRIAALVREREQQFADLLAKAIAVGQEKSQINKSRDPEVFANLMISMITGMVIRDSAPIGVDRATSAKAAKTMVINCLSPKAS